MKLMNYSPQHKMNNRIRVLFFIPWLGGGGAERTFLNILNLIDRKRFEPILVLCRKKGNYLNLLNPDVRIVSLDTQLRFSLLPLVRRIRKMKPDLMVSTLRLTNLVAVLARNLSGSRTKVIVRETNNLTAAGIDPKKFGERVVGWAYRKSDRVISLSEGVKVDLEKRYRIRPEHITRIYNPVDVTGIKKLAALKPDDERWCEACGSERCFKIISVGKLFFQKGHDLLIQAMDKVRDLPVHLSILGEGPEHERLEEMVRKSNLGSRISFLGFKENPYSYMARSDLMVLSSRWEGFGHVIVEAMVCQTPVLSVDCPSGPSEIIDSGKNGVLCLPNSPEIVAEHIRNMYEDAERRSRYIQRANETVNRFDIRRIVREYECVFESVLLGSPQVVDRHFQ